MNDTATRLTWQDVLDDSSLRNLPHKIELNEEGQIVMSPAKSGHNRIQSKIVAELLERAGGDAWVEAAIELPSGVTYAADVIWCQTNGLRNTRIWTR